ncbi:MAG: tRNA-dihydrouridine synthase [Desulfomicrobium sp.]|nr:tRNA-dihydrouridine synthase [Pseudomonadota bacterium]MBV1712414.1 tRNA-dihydrouridine synthase [Desulfomicrobium sp.]MBU4571126.1 tRNA-dihydrouridine synthase [Pseudomonadota bacterium]MBU4592863.1 tRNA-dihydrouridine synthase [Pseudomonadota bacterium]MBV1720485.1 tRNA-dihydrouridine synthase [Desulfomicrobium sp.]
MSTPIFPITPDRPWLAPLAGFSDLPFRLLCHDLGCHTAVTEMISAKGLIYKSPGTKELLQTCEQDSPLIVQLFGSEEPFLVQSIERLRAEGFRYFDLNCGCPVRKVAKTGSGAALLKEPAHLLHLAKAMIAATEPGCMGFKIRLGWHIGQPVYLPLAKELEELGAGWITMHPRFGAQGFTGHADWSHLKTLKANISLPVIASGDLFQAEDGLRCVDQTGVDSIMFARGALSDPSIFSRYLRLRQAQEPEEKSCLRITAMVRRLSELYAEHGMERLGLLKMRTLVPRFLKGLPGARAFRRDIVFCKSWDEVFHILENEISGFEEN